MAGVNRCETAREVTKTENEALCGSEESQDQGLRLIEGLKKRKVGWRKRRCGCGLRCSVARCYRHLYEELLAVVRNIDGAMSAEESGADEMDKRVEFCEDDLIG